MGILWRQEAEGHLVVSAAAHFNQGAPEFRAVCLLEGRHGKRRPRSRRTLGG